MSPFLPGTTARAALSIVVLFACLTFAKAWGLNSPNQLSNEELATIMTPNGKKILAEIADTPAKRSRGLMFRTEMAPDRGMLFIFKDLDLWTFWMKNTKMPLDLIWLDMSKEVVHIEPHVPICARKDEGCPRYRTSEKALYVLELGAGMASEFEISKGARLDISLP